MVGVEGRGFGDGVEGLGQEMKQVRPIMGRHQLGEWVAIHCLATQQAEGPSEVPWKLFHSPRCIRLGYGGSSGRQ